EVELAALEVVEAGVVRGRAAAVPVAGADELVQHPNPAAPGLAGREAGRRVAVRIPGTDAEGHAGVRRGGLRAGDADVEGVGAVLGVRVGADRLEVAAAPVHDGALAGQRLAAAVQVAPGDDGAVVARRLQAGRVGEGGHHPGEGAALRGADVGPHRARD